MTTSPKTLHVELGNTGPVDGRTDVTRIRELWEEVHARLREEATRVAPWSGSEQGFLIRVDASDVLDFFRAIETCEVDSSLLDDRFTHRRSLGRHMLGSHLTVYIDEVPGSGIPAEGYAAVGKFLQHMFLSLNITLPGSFSLGLSRYLEHEDALPSPPRLYAGDLETATTLASDRGWPPIARLDFDRTWSWITHGLPYETEVAGTAAQRALLSLLRIADPNRFEVDVILLVAQVLEAFFSDGREGIVSVLKQRLELVLGRPETHGRWFTKFYALRSRIAHGAMPVMRPGSFYQDDDPEVLNYRDSVLTPVDEAVAVLVALLQDLATHGSYEYVFVQEVLRPPATS